MNGIQTSAYKIDLKSMRKDRHSVDIHLGDDFFANADMTDIAAGSIEVAVRICKIAEIFDLSFDLRGQATVLCDRCLTPLTLPVETNAHLTVRFGSDHSQESDDILVVRDSNEGSLDLSWLLYEYTLLSLPMQRLHSEPDCNPETMAIYKMHMAVEAKEEEGDRERGNIDEAQNVVSDPRWEALKALKDGSNND